MGKYILSRWKVNSFFWVMPERFCLNGSSADPSVVRTLHAVSILVFLEKFAFVCSKRDEIGNNDCRLSYIEILELKSIYVSVRRLRPYTNTLACFPLAGAARLQ